MSKVVVAGTFNRLHAGHRSLLIKAVWRAMNTPDHVLEIGITSDEFAQSTRDVPVRPYEERMRDVNRFLHRYLKDLDHTGMYPGDTLRIRGGYHIVHSKTDMMRMYKGDTLVVSEETEANARQVLKAKGYRCKVVVVPMVKDEQGREIHSTDIINQEKGAAKPCPFCGGRVELRPKMDGEAETYFIFCTRCNMWFEKFVYRARDPEAIIAEWNERVN